MMQFSGHENQICPLADARFVWAGMRFERNLYSCVVYSCIVYSNIVYSNIVAMSTGER